MSQLKTILLIFFSFIVTILSSQNIDKANTYYKDGYYAKAIPIYNALIKKNDSREIKSKLANCYRILNQAEKALAIYQMIVSEDNVPAVEYFRLGEVLMTLGQYDSAKIYFKRFNDINPDDEQGTLMLKSLEKIKDIHSVLKNIIVEPFKHNTDADESVPVFYQNNLVFASDRSSGFNLLKQKNPTTGRDYITLFVSEKMGDTAFNKPIELSSKLTEINKNTGNISFTADGKYAFFCRNSLTSSKNGTYNMQLYSAEQNEKGGWEKIKLLPFCTNEQNYMYPSVSADGSTLFFVMVRSDGVGGLDIYMSKKTKKGWSRPENIGDKVNTPGHEGFPYISNNGNLYFCSKGHAGYGGYDIFVTSQDSTGEWKTPENIGLPINSAYDDISFSFADSTWGAFTSARSGRGDDIFFFKIKNSLPALIADSLLTDKPRNYNGFTFDIETISDNSIDIFDTNDITVQIDTDTITFLTHLQQKTKENSLRIGDVFIVDNIRFDNNQDAVLSSDIKIEIEKIISFLLDNKSIIIEIGAYTDSLPKYETEVEKSIVTDTTRKRAEAIVQYMIDKGIKSRRVIAKGYGDAVPASVIPNDTVGYQQHKRNQRVEIKILKL